MEKAQYNHSHFVSKRLCFGIVFVLVLFLIPFLGMKAFNEIRISNSPKNILQSSGFNSYYVFDGDIEKSAIQSISFVSSLEDAGQSAWDVSQDKNRSVMAWTVKNGNLYDLYIGANGKIYAPDNCGGLFSGYTEVESIRFNDNFDTSHATNMRAMFYDCHNLASLDVSGFNTSSVTDMSLMFASCADITVLNLSSFDTSLVTTMGGMFSECENLTSLNISNFNTSHLSADQVLDIFVGYNNYKGSVAYYFENNKSSGFEVIFIHSLGEEGESAQIFGKDPAGNLLWTYTTKTYEPQQLYVVSEIGKFNDIYYFCEDGTIIALDVSSGLVIWKNTDFSSLGPIGIVWNEVLYLSGYFGPDFFAIDRNGTTLCCYDQFDSEYFWPGKIAVEDGEVAIYFDMGPESAGNASFEDFIFRVNPETFAYYYYGSVQ